MSGHMRDLGDAPRVVRVDVGVADAARRAVLARVDRGELTRQEAHTVLDQLGLLPGQTAPKTRR